MSDQEQTTTTQAVPKEKPVEGGQTDERALMAWGDYEANQDFVLTVAIGASLIPSSWLAQIARNWLVGAGAPGILATVLAFLAFFLVGAILDIAIIVLVECAMDSVLKWTGRQAPAEPKDKDAVYRSSAIKHPVLTWIALLTKETWVRMGVFIVCLPIARALQWTPLHDFMVPYGVLGAIACLLLATLHWAFDRAARHLS